MPLTSLKDLSKAFNLLEPAPKVERPRKCRFCGSEMEHIGHTNVYVCHGELTTKNDKGEEEKKPCTNVILGRA